MLKPKFTKLKNAQTEMDKERMKDIFARLGYSHGLIVIKPWLPNWYSILNTTFPPITPLLCLLS